MFSEAQYDKAIENLKRARSAISNPVPGCAVCGGSCLPHQCGDNPLYAMHMCEQISKGAEQLHHTLHVLSGDLTYMGERMGPAAIRVPKEDRGHE